MTALTSMRIVAPWEPPMPSSTYLVRGRGRGRGRARGRARGRVTVRSRVG